MVRPNIVWILGWDPRHHEELLNGLEIKIHIRKVVSRVSKKLKILPYCIKKVLRVPHEAHLPRRVQNELMGGTTWPTWARACSPLSPWLSWGKGFPLVVAAPRDLGGGRNPPAPHDNIKGGTRGIATPNPCGRPLPFSLLLLRRHLAKLCQNSTNTMLCY
jgi:hypothetical protein